MTDKRPSPVGQPAKVELTVKLVVSRAVAECLTARAIREERKLEALIQEAPRRRGQIAHVATPNTGISEYHPSPSGTSTTSC